MAAMRRGLLLLCLLAALAFAGQAAAAEVVLADDQGRSIHFDVRAEGADAEWYAALLRAAPLADEIATLRIDVVSLEELHSICGSAADGCYSRDVMVVPAGQDAGIAHILLHEYGHHLDRSQAVTGVSEPNGTPVWWRARGMAELVRLRSVSRSYSLGWDRSIAEIFAEDYARLALGQTEHRITWLGEPDANVLAAIKADLGLGPAPVTVSAPALKPVSIARNGTLAPRRQVAIPFGLLGPDRRVTATATFAGKSEKKARAVLEIRCAGGLVSRKTIGAGTTKITIDRPDLGPADCAATLTSTSAAARTYTLVVKLSIDQSP
jgi:hypothetical protein